MVNYRSVIRSVNKCLCNNICVVCPDDPLYTLEIITMYCLKSYNNKRYCNVKKNNVCVCGGGIVPMENSCVFSQHFTPSWQKFSHLEAVAKRNPFAFPLKALLMVMASR